MRIFYFEGKKNISGRRICEARKNEGLTQKDLAAKLQVAGVNLERDSISRIEKGERIVTDFELLIFADLLGVSPLWLLGLK